MKAYIATTAIGVFAYDDKGKLIAEAPFTNDLDQISDRLKTFNKGEVIPELFKVFKEVSPKAEEVIIESDNILDLEAIIEKPNLAGKLARQDLSNLAKKHGFKNLDKFIFDLNRSLTKNKLQEELSKDDRKIGTVVLIVDDLDDTINTLAERLRDWYKLFFPEAVAKLKDNEAFIVQISRARSRKDFQGELQSIAGDTVGGKFKDQDLERIQDLANSLNQQYKLRNKLIDYLQHLMQGIAPNLKEVAGELVGARLISATGGRIERLAILPSSTIQVLGAEKALFRHLTTGAKSPKHGIIVNHQLVAKAPSEYKGKVARTVAAAISLAIKKDVYSKEDMGRELRQDLEKKVATILAKDPRSRESKPREFDSRESNSRPERGERKERPERRETQERENIPQRGERKERGYRQEREDVFESYSRDKDSQPQNTESSHPLERPKYSGDSSWKFDPTKKGRSGKSKGKSRGGSKFKKGRSGGNKKFDKSKSKKPSGGNKK